MTIIEQLKNSKQLQENQEIEFKSAKGGFPDSFWSSFSAFANTNGGVIVLGVRQTKDKFIPDGLTKEMAEKYRQKFWNDAHNKMCVNIPLLMESDVDEFVTEGDSHILIFNVPRAEYNLKPVHLTLTPFGHTYKRKNEGDYLCSDDEVRQMYSDANNLKSSADSRILRGYTIDDIDLPTLNQYRMRYSLRHENHPWNEVDNQKFLENIGAYRKDRSSGTEGFTVAGILMFGKSGSITDPECCPYFFPDYRERLSDDPKIRWTNRVYPDGTYECNLYQFFTRVLPMLQHALPVPFKLDENQMRVDTTTAHIALREAFANAVIHCSYTSLANITIDRYPDRIVISNPGTMLVSLKEFYEGNHSVCRNPLIQKMFVFIGVGEKAGSGADTIAKGWKDNGWNLPVVTEYFSPDRIETVLNVTVNVTVNSADVTVNDPVNSGDDPLNGENDPVNSESDPVKVKNDTVNDPVNGENDPVKVNDNGQKSSYGDTVNLTDRQIKIISLLERNAEISKTEIASVLGVSKESIKRDFDRLKKLGIIIRVGSDKTGHWKIIKK